ncbi:MAG: alpha/beta hydrolase, partial [Hyphomicrobiales bacterium]
VTLLGTSRGGIIGMVIALVQPQFLAGLMLNDVGPRLEPAGLLRIGKYVGASPCYRDWATAARSFAATQDGFSGVSAATWDAVVRRIYVETPEGIRPQHDPALKTTFPDAETIEAGKLPELWDVIPALQQLPVSVLRGANSDLLSPETVERMAGLLPQLDATSVAGRGHVPFLDEPESIAAIARWLSRVDAHEKGPG